MEGNIIKILPEGLANKIAAGEVVERPASVVKELIENSKDAGAQHITIIIKGGGKESIKVIDDGTGMTREDAIIAFERHATSKIKTEADMESIKTLGFRGEALPSISAVSKVILKTSSGGIGTCINIAGGGEKEIKDTAYPKGTAIEVYDLFFNTPARWKFLKSKNTELSYINRTIIQQILSNPDIHIKLDSDDKTIIDSPPVKGDLRAKVSHLFGADIVNDLLYIEEESDGIKLHGLISKPSTTRSCAENQYIFINGRFIKDKSINHAVREGYRNNIPASRCPITFLYIDINHEEIDVNVHPSKTEVRFLRQDSVYRLVKRSINNAAYGKDAIYMPEMPSKDWIREPSADYKNTALFGESEKEISEPPDQKTRIQNAISTYLYDIKNYSEEHPNPDISACKKTGNDIYAVSSPSGTQFNPIGQLDNSYIILEGKEGLLIIDQHAAHERIIYESLLKEIKEKNITIQNLLIPLNLELNKQEAAVLTEYMSDISKLGIEIEPFGGNTFILRAVPAIIIDHDYLKIITDIIYTLSETGYATPFDHLLEKLAATMSCHSAVRANHPLDIKEMKYIADLIENGKISYTCPHGRPIAILIGIDDIKKKFMR